MDWRSEEFRFWHWKELFSSLRSPHELWAQVLSIWRRLTAPSSVNVKNERSFSYTSPYVCMAWTDYCVTRSADVREGQRRVRGHENPLRAISGRFRVKSRRRVTVTCSSVRCKNFGSLSHVQSASDINPSVVSRIFRTPVYFTLIQQCFKVLLRLMNRPSI